MPQIERWLSENEFKFIRKPGVGLVLDESLENQKKILKLLDVEVIRKVYSKEQRRKFLFRRTSCFQRTKKIILFYIKV